MQALLGDKRKKLQQSRQRAGGQGEQLAASPVELPRSPLTFATLQGALDVHPAVVLHRLDSAKVFKIVSLFLYPETPLAKDHAPRKQRATARGKPPPADDSHPQGKENDENDCEVSSAKKRGRISAGPLLSDDASRCAMCDSVCDMEEYFGNYHERVFHCKQCGHVQDGWVTYANPYRNFEGEEDHNQASGDALCKLPHWRVRDAVHKVSGAFESACRLYDCDLQVAMDMVHEVSWVCNLQNAQSMTTAATAALIVVSSPKLRSEHTMQGAGSRTAAEPALHSRFECAQCGAAHGSSRSSKWCCRAGMVSPKRTTMKCLGSSCA